MPTATVSRFPALTVKGRVVELVGSAEELTSCTPTALKNGWFEGLLIVDAEGMGYLVEKAEFVRKKGRLLKSLFSPSVIEVSLAFKQGSPFAVPLGDFKSYLAKAIRADPDFWASGGSDPKAMIETIQRASSREEVLAFITPFLTAGLERQGT